MIVKMNGKQINQDVSLSDKFNQVVKETNDLVESSNRATRRTTQFKSAIASLGFITTLGLATVAKAEENMPTGEIPTNSILMKMVFDKVLNSNYTTGTNFRMAVGDGLLREDTVIWKMNDWFQTVLLHTTDFFSNPQIMNVFNSVWTICMSFTTLIIAKKGFDMVKARVLGTSTLGATEIVVRLLASVVMTFLSLGVIQLGIEASNLTITTLFKSLESNLIPYESLTSTSSLGLIFWFIGYCFMFAILAVQYWIRQITVVMVGVLMPVATMSWVTDGGRMLGTMVKELITLLATPLTHGLILGISSVMMLEVTTMTGNQWIDTTNSMLIGFSSMFLMVFTPSILRKFITGSGNPVSWAWSVGKGGYGNAMKLAKLLK